MIREEPAEKIEISIHHHDSAVVIGHLHQTIRGGKERSSFTLSDNVADTEMGQLLLTHTTSLQLSFQDLFKNAETGIIADSAPDRWGREIMKKMARAREISRTLGPTDYLLAVTDDYRLGALRFRCMDGDDPELVPYEAEGGPDPIPKLIDIRALQAAADRIIKGTNTPEDLRLMFVSGSPMGGARPKAVVRDQDDEIWIAKFAPPGEVLGRSVERWEMITHKLATAAGLKVPQAQIIARDDRPIYLSKRFDRNQERRIMYASAMALTGHEDGDNGGTYLELVDIIKAAGADAKAQTEELFRRVAFSVGVSNVDDHLRNHGFLLTKKGWALSPAFDINPTPEQEKAPSLTTAINYDDGTCSYELLLDHAVDYLLSADRGAEIIQEVSDAIGSWRQVAEKSGAPNSEITEMESAFRTYDTSN